jgi:predicted enzyme related to lactoylglutathione lyase
MASTATAGATITGVDIFGPATPDGKRLIAFYRDALGMKPTMESPEGQGAEFELADGTTFGVYQPDGAQTGGGYSALFAVGDIHAAVDRFRAQGAVLQDPFETPVCFMAFGKDPDGNEFGIHQRKQPS